MAHCQGPSELALRDTKLGEDDRPDYSQRYRKKTIQSSTPPHSPRQTNIAIKMSRCETSFLGRPRNRRCGDWRIWGSSWWSGVVNARLSLIEQYQQGIYCQATT